MSDKAQTALDNLQLALHGVTAPFFCAGTFTPDAPVTLVFKDRTRFAVVRADGVYAQTSALKPLRDHCKPAPFGAGKKTRYDRQVRDALQLNAENGGFTVRNFDPEAAGILQEVQRGLVPHDPNPISADLYTLNVYTAGGHFAPHKDTPRGVDMFGTLVVCLPAQFGGGGLILRHRGVVEQLHWGRAIQAQKPPNQVHWAAFFGDVDHQIDRVWSGARVTLTYLLRRGGGAAPEAADEELAPRVQEAWRALLAEPSFLPKGGTVAYPCGHLYHQDARFQQEPSPLRPHSVSMLKGRDHLAAATALQAGLEVTFAPYMFENCADGTWQLDRFPTRAEKTKLGRQMDDTDLERILPIRGSSEQEGDFGLTWLEPPPTNDQYQSRSEGDEDSGPPAAAHLHSCEYCPWGYFGNEGSDVDLYTFAALHIEIPPYGKGVRKATKPLTRSPAKRPRPTRRRKTSD
jgi:hypothetical protein